MIHATITVILKGHPQWSYYNGQAAESR